MRSARMNVCVLTSTTRQQEVCNGVCRYLNDVDRVLIETRATADGFTVCSAHTHVCLFHYHKYLYHWKAEGCIDPQCCLLHDTQVGYRALVQCPQRVLSVLQSIYKLPTELPIGSLIHKRPCLATFDSRYKCHDGYQPAKKRQRVRHCPSQQKCDDKVRMYS
jgi:hypothetical protein